MSELEQPLSGAGRDRREAILRMAVQAARQKRRRRGVVRGVSAACGLILAGAIALQWSNELSTRTPVTAPHDYVAAPRDPAPAPMQPAFAFARIETDPSIADRLAVAPAPPRWTSIDDDELFASLAQAGQSAGLIEVGGETILVAQTSLP